MMKNSVLLALALSIVSSQAIFAQDDEKSALSLAVAEALASDIRTEKDTARDRNRQPAKTLEFFGIKQDMKVLELFPGGGWYTKILAPVLQEDGELYVALGTNNVSEKLVGEVDGFDDVVVLETGAELNKGELVGTYNISEFNFGERGFDAVLTFRNMHNLDAASRNTINKQVYSALKRGGIYGVVDHTRRHMEPHTKENRRRADPVVIIKELVDLGFVFDGYSDLHYRSDDELRFEVGRKTVTGNTDRFTLLFKKPK